MMERPMINATMGFAFRADGKLAGDGKADAVVVIEVELVNVDVEAIQWWCGVRSLGLFGSQRVPVALVMDDNMDVDPGSPTSSGHKRAPTSPPASSSANKRLKPILPTAQLEALNNAMEKLSRRNQWQRRFADAQNDASQSAWRDLFSDVLICLSLLLSTTNLKDSVIPPIAYDKADSLVNDLTDEEFKEWVNGVQTGVKKNDWEHLIVHCTYILHLKTWPSLIATAAKLQARIPAQLSLSGNM
jgi:hypothetical protein